MGKKKSAPSKSQHIQESMGQMVSNAALNKLGPQIEQTIKAYIQQLGNQLAVQQASTLETLFARVVVLESIVMEKLGYAPDDLTAKVAGIEDDKEGLDKINGPVELGDVVRLEIKTKTQDQPEFQGSSRLKIYQTGSGQTIGQELETAVVGMSPGETKEVTFGKDGLLTASIKIDRVSRKPEEQEAPNADQVQG